MAISITHEGATSAIAPSPLPEHFESQTPLPIQTLRPQAATGEAPADVNAHTVLALMALTIAFLLAFSTQLYAKSPTASIPKNAHAKSYGDGWVCDPSFRIEGDQCTAVVVPENAYPTNRTYGLGWKCLHGFEEVADASCVEVFVPTGGYLDPSGSRWGCLRGHRKIKDTCKQILLPAHSYLSDDRYGPGWTCERGYTQTSDDCAAIVVPENAFLNAASHGQPWLCGRGYRETNGACEAVVIPANGYFDDAPYGPGWKCMRGFSASDDACAAIVLPANAHLDRSGNRWGCNRNFQRSKNLCVLEN